MAFLDLFRRTRRTDPSFGDLVFRRHGWDGQVIVPELLSTPILLRIEAPKTADLAPLRVLYGRVLENLADVKAEIAEEAYKTFCWNLEEDRRSGNVTDDILADYPRVSSVKEIWNVLTPFALGFADRTLECDWYLALDVYWANPHYFRAQFRELKLQELAVDG